MLQLRQGFAQQAGALRTTIENPRFLAGRPSARYGFSGKVHDGVKTLQAIPRDCSRAGIPQYLASPRRVEGPNEACYLVAIRGEKRDQRLTN
jgi:hypothetical protein